MEDLPWKESDLFHLMCILEPLFGKIIENDVCFTWRNRVFDIPKGVKHDNFSVKVQLENCLFPMKFIVDEKDGGLVEYDPLGQMIELQRVPWNHEAYKNWKIYNSQHFFL